MSILLIKETLIVEIFRHALAWRRQIGLQIKAEYRLGNVFRSRHERRAGGRVGGRAGCTYLSSTLSELSKNTHR